MADDKTKTGQQDRSRVNTTESYEVQHEAKKTGKSTIQVRAAATKAGPLRKDIERELSKGR